MAQETIGVKIQVDSNAPESVGSLKQQLKQAQEQVTILAAKFGDTSKEATDAAKKAAALKDAIGDAKALTDTFNPDKKFVAFGGALQGVTAGFAGLQGAMGLFGAETEGVEKALLKVQSAMALQQGISGIAGAMDSVKLFGKNLIDTLGKSGAIGLAIAGVTALGLAISGIFTNKQKADAKAYNDTLEDYKKAAAGAIEETTKVRIAFQDARKGVISKDSALKLYNDTLGDSLGKTTDLSVAEKNLADKSDAYIKMTALKAQANALFSKSAEASADALIYQQKLEKGGLAGKGGIGGEIYRLGQIGIKKTLQDAKDIQDLGESLLKQANSIAAQYSITTNKVAESTSKISKTITKKEEPISEGREIEGGEFAGWKKSDIKSFKAKQDELAMRAELEKNFEENRAAMLGDYRRMEEEDAIESVNQLIEQENLKIAIAQKAAEERVATAQFVSNQLQVFSDIVGKETAAGKVLAVASATINTYLAATQALKADYSMYGPAAQFVRIASVVSTIALGFKQVKEIVKVKVPAKGGAPSISTPSISANAPAPIIPSTPQAALTTLDNQTINRLGSASARSYVIESDVTNNQERIRRINRAARLN